MDRRSFVAGALALLAAPLGAEAQQTGTPHRIAIVLGVSPLATMLGPEPAHPYVRALMLGLRDLGYVEGRNLIIERRSLEGRYDRAPETFRDLLRLKVQVIVALPQSAGRAARRATATVPIVIGDASDEGDDPLAGSLARPGGNVTGMGVAPPEFTQKWLEFLKEAVPGLNRVAVLSDGVNPNADRQQQLRALEAAARALQLELSIVEASNVDHLTGALEAAIRQRPQALVSASGATLFAARRQIVAFAKQHRLPMVAAYREFVEDGALMSYVVDWRDVYRRVATYVDRILKGAKPGDLPIERPTKFELLINLKTAKALGFTIPPPLLLRADEVIE